MFTRPLNRGSSIFVAVARSATEPRAARRWNFLALIFFFLALDEQAAIHERFTGPLRDLLPDTGLLHHAWVVLYVAILIPVGLWIGPFILRQASVARRWFIAAAVTFLTGAVGLEVIGGWRRSLVGMTEFDPVYDLLSTTEEALELFGLIFLAVALLHLLRLQRERGTLSIEE